MPVLITYKGGPRDGQTKEYSMDPVIIGCASEALAKNMRGVYQTGGRYHQRVTEGRITAVWKNLPRIKKK